MSATVETVVDALTGTADVVLLALSTVDPRAWVLTACLLAGAVFGADRTNNPYPDHLEEVTLAVNNERGACRPYKHGFQRAQPKRHQGRYGVVVWRLRWRDYSSGKPVLRQRSFPTEAEALAFIDTHSWWN